MKNAWKSLGVGAASIVLLTLVAYWPVLRGEFSWDDAESITDNRLIKAKDGLYRIWFTTEPADYYPVTNSLWWLEWRCWGGNPAGYHVINVALHAANAVLVWMILRALGVRAAWLAGLVFALHPVNVATAAWISEHKNTLSMLFAAVAILFYLRFDDDSREYWYDLSVTAFLLALLSKSAVLMLPVILLGCLWWRHGTLRYKDFLRTLPFFALSLVMGLVTIWFQQYRVLGVHVVRTAGAGSRLVTAGWLVFFYLYKSLLPVNLMAIYPKWDVDASRWISYLPGIALVGCFALFWWKRRSWGRPLLFGVGYFVVMLVPVLGFVDQAYYRYALVADHWQYYSIVGIIAVAVTAGDTIFRRAGEPGRHWAPVASVALVLMLGVASWKRNCVYAKFETLWQDNLAKNPGAWAAHNNLGLSLAHKGKVDEAIEHYQESLRINPGQTDARVDLGNLFLQTGKLEAAIEQYEQVLRVEPETAGVHYNLGIALVQLNRTQEAIGHWEQALRLEPDFADAHYNLGIAMEREGRVREAVAHYEEAVRLRPDFAEAQNRLLQLRAIR